MEEQDIIIYSFFLTNSWGSWVGFPLLTQGWDNHPECVQQASNKKVSQLEVSSISRSVPARKTLGLLRQKWNDTAAVKTKQKRCTAHILPPTSQLLLVVVEGQEYRHQRRGSSIGK